VRSNDGATSRRVDMSLADSIPGFAPKREVHESVCGYVVTVTPPEFMALPSQSVCLTPDQFLRYKQWRDGVLFIQDALPELSAADKEILMSGIGPDEWDEMWSDESEEEHL
jgi:hypothetical protein